MTQKADKPQNIPAQFPMHVDPAREAEFAKAALLFLSRVNLTGQEVPAFIDIHNWLNMKANNVKGTPPDVE